MSKEKILIINAGSSSIKFKVFNKSDKKVIATGLCEKIFIGGNFIIKYLKNNQWNNLEKELPLANHDVAIKTILNYLKELAIIDDVNYFVGIGHRVVFGGKYKDSVLVDDEVLKDIHAYEIYAPLHNKPEHDVIKVFKEITPNVPNVAVFDTSFHNTIPEENYIYPIDQNVAKKYGIRRYGFHGVSYKYITKHMSEILNKEKVNLIVCHIGNGASITAIKNSQSYNTSMGLTPLEGVMMGTRCGNIDPAILILLARQGYDFEQLDTLLNKQSGLKGMSGESDMRENVKRAKNNDHIGLLTVEMFANRVVEYIIKYANQLENKIDGVVFTAGVGENDKYVVKKIIDKIKLVNIELDLDRFNADYDDYKLVTTKKSQWPIYVMRTDEETTMAKDVERIVFNKK